MMSTSVSPLPSRGRVTNTPAERTSGASLTFVVGESGTRRREDVGGSQALTQTTQHSSSSELVASSSGLGAPPFLIVRTRKRGQRTHSDNTTRQLQPKWLHSGYGHGHQRRKRRRTSRRHTYKSIPTNCSDQPRNRHSCMVLTVDVLSESSILIKDYKSRWVPGRL